jgi:hypothetical protein
LLGVAWCKLIAGGTSIAPSRRMRRAMGVLMIVALLLTPVACRRQAPPAPSAPAPTAF